MILKKIVYQITSSRTTDCFIPRDGDIIDGCYKAQLSGIVDATVRFCSICEAFEINLVEFSQACERASMEGWK